MRVIGQRESGGLGISDILLVVLVAEAATRGLTGGTESLTDSVILVATVLFWSLVIDAVAYRSPRLAGILKARSRRSFMTGARTRRSFAMS